MFGLGYFYTFIILYRFPHRDDDLKRRRSLQHNFPGTYFARQKEWNHLTASLRGASCFKLPPILQWATGNIGFHHAHHVPPRIPNYNLPQCYAETQELHVKGLTLRRSLGALFLSLWDEDQKKLKYQAVFLY